MNKMKMAIHHYFTAAEKGNLKCIEELLNAGADVNIIDNKGNTALARASFKGDVDCLKELIAAGADVIMGKYPPLTNAAREGHLDCIN